MDDKEKQGIQADSKLLVGLLDIDIQELLKNEQDLPLEKAVIVAEANEALWAYHALRVQHRRKPTEKNLDRLLTQALWIGSLYSELHTIDDIRKRKRQIEQLRENNAQKAYASDVIDLAKLYNDELAESVKNKSQRARIIQDRLRNAGKRNRKGQEIPFETIRDWLKGW